MIGWCMVADIRGHTCCSEMVRMNVFTLSAVNIQYCYGKGKDLDGMRI